ncbi:hypothetical protein [Ligilactobacillus equi]|uniref:HTH cro/C1-type domain-containing protein n=1 Tax=Ligilactobacillus equi DSM 15833 = JCM 10991 TaxID=1423740 RepID=A0A0R1TSI0_9LACO|nr:hypothetical protein [Ligilactobacillus equi]KRL81770.1 hypothetical protein FC36_GL001362 [Ligilactobacillus equi DSM 15833 = JCM 10991]
MTEIVKENARQILADEIAKRGLKKTYVAEKMGYKNLQKLSYILTGRDKFTGDVALRASKALGVSYKIFLR